MKYKFFLLWVLTLLLLLPQPVVHAENLYGGAIDGIFSLATDNQSMQQWVDGVLAENAGSNMDSYIIALNQMGASVSLEKYIESAAGKLNSGAISNVVTRMRCALALISCGAYELLPEGFADESIGKLGMMSYVFGLHLLNNGVASNLWTADTIAEKLIAMQKEDGGWAVSGNFGDADVTAMCLQALAVYEGREKYKDQIESALTFLSEKQLDNGGFVSYGRENCESSAQVLIALVSLDIDPLTDGRFLKEGSSAVDALMDYQRSGGGFAHLPGEDVNEMASAQALQALLALENIRRPYYNFSYDLTRKAVVEKQTLLSGWKLWAVFIIAAFAVVGSVFALTRRHGRLKQLIFVLAVCAIALFAVFSLKIESTEAYYSQSAEVRGKSAGSVYLSIRCDTVAGRNNDGSTPEDGIILDRTAIPCYENDSVFDILTDAARKFNIQMEHEGGSGDLAYVTGINYLYEYAHGDLSGWIYTLNGERLSIGCGACDVKNGDEIIWHYTLNIGEDLK